MDWVRAWLIGLAPPEADSARIVSILPETECDYQVEIEYNLISAESGRVTLMIEQGESGYTPLGSVTEVVQKGKARLVLNTAITVPETNASQVFIPLHAAFSL